MKIRLVTKSTSAAPLRSSLLALHTSGVIRVFRTHSIFRLWEPLREHRRLGEDFSD
jgi:hypothetical protein